MRAGFPILCMRGLLALMLGSLAFSSTSVAAWGLEDLRMVLFAALFAAYALGAVLLSPRFAPHGRAAPLLALWLLILVALATHVAAPMGGGALVDHKILLPILALLLAPNMRAAMGRMDVARMALVAGGLYVVATAGLALALPAAATLRNVAAHVRVDITGSVVLHASLCTIIALVAAAALASARRPGTRLKAALVLGIAAWMVALTGTRSPLLALACFVILWAVAGKAGDLGRPRVLGLGFLALLVFALLTLAASDTIWARLTELGRADYSSGRLPSIRHWLLSAAGEPFGLGLGAVRRILADGRPEIAGGHLLEWPHNELVRFYVEGGVLGFTLVLILMAETLRRAVRRARATADPVERALLLAIAADMLTQCLLQNYFNGIYHATMMLLLVSLLAAKPCRPSQATPQIKVGHGETLPPSALSYPGAPL